MTAFVSLINKKVSLIYFIFISIVPVDEEIARVEKYMGLNGTTKPFKG